MNKLRVGCFLQFVFGVFASDKAHPQVVPADDQPGVERIAARLSEMNEKRKAALTSYESQRLMTVTYQGPLSQGDASETVSMLFSAPSSKQFTVISATGAQLIRDNVFLRALTAEQVAAGDAAQQASALNLQNYTMRLVGREQLAIGNCFVLDVTPKVASEFTYSGRVWVQATDYAVARIQGKPAIKSFTMDL